MIFNYNKIEGLQKGYKEGKQIDFISDLHLDFYCRTKDFYKEEIRMLIEKFRSSMQHKSDEIIIVAGDISHSNEVSSEFISQLADTWDTVLIIPGNHDWYLQDKNTEDRYADLIKELEYKENVFFLMDETEIYEHSGIKIAGTIMFYNLHELNDYIMWKSVLNDKAFLTREFINNRNAKDVEYYNKVINEVDLFVSHVPIVNLDGSYATYNLFLNMDVNPVEKVLYVSGHTHRPKSSTDIYSQYDAINIGYGYPSESDYKKEAVTSIFFTK